MPSMFRTTIAALATAPAPAGVAVIRISGEDAGAAIQALFRSRQNPLEQPRMLCFGAILNEKRGAVIDYGLCVFMPGPKSFTGEDVAEFHLHGSPLIAKRVLQALFAFGITPAEPGEFTKRAFFNGKLDLVQAEAVGELISATSESALRIASDHLAGTLSDFLAKVAEPLRDVLAEIQAHLDFPEEDIQPASLRECRAAITKAQEELGRLAKSFTRGKRLREGYKILLCGPPNAGKSSLFNALLGRERAIVTDISGTTRDVLEEDCALQGHRFVLCDSAGITKTDDIIERMGIELSLERLAWADLVLLVIDGSAEYPAFHELVRLIGEKAKNVWMVTNKVDLRPREIGKYYCDSSVCKQNFYLSVKTGDGIDSLRNALIEEVEGVKTDFSDSSVIITQARHASLVDQAIQHFSEADSGIRADLPLEVVSEEIRLGLSKLDEIIGKTYTEDILGRIFSKFCIGK